MIKHLPDIRDGGMPLDCSDEYEGQEFVGLMLDEGVSYRGKVFVNCRFDRCSLSGTEFISCEFDDCTFMSSDLSLAKLTDSVFKSTRIVKSRAVGINWTQTRWPAKPLDPPVEFSESLLDYSVFLGLNLRSIVIKDCRAHDADFSECNMEKSTLEGTDFARARFSHTVLTDASLLRATNYFIELSSCHIDGAMVDIPEGLSLLKAIGVRVEGWDDAL